MMPGVQSRFHGQGLARGERQGLDPRLSTGTDESRPVLRSVFGQRNEETACVLDAMGDDPPEDPVFSDAFPGGFEVVYGIAGAAVQEALVPSGCAGGEIVLFHEEGGDAAQRQVSRDACPRCAAADDQHFRLQVHRTPAGERADYS